MASLLARAERRALALQRLQKAAEAVNASAALPTSKDAEIASILVIEYAADVLEEVAARAETPAEAPAPKGKKQAQEQAK